jgi:hypothetical protein
MHLWGSVQEEEEGAREEGYNLDSDYQPARRQEGGNVTMATQTTRQRVI